MVAHRDSLNVRKESPVTEWVKAGGLAYAIHHPRGTPLSVVSWSSSPPPCSLCSSTEPLEHKRGQQPCRQPGSCLLPQHPAGRTSGSAGETVCRLVPGPSPCHRAVGGSLTAGCKALLDPLPLPCFPLPRRAEKIKVWRTHRETFLREQRSARSGGGGGDKRVFHNPVNHRTLWVGRSL